MITVYGIDDCLNPVKAQMSDVIHRCMVSVLQMPQGQVDRIAKMIRVQPGQSVKLREAIDAEPRMRQMEQEEESVRRLFEIAGQLEGLYRHASTHAAGVVIGDRPLHEVTPLYRDPKSDMPATQFNMKWVEAAGLVKFDFLGLKTLTVIQNAVDLIREGGRHLHIAPDGRALYAPPEGAVDEINAIPLDDKPTYELYSAAKTVAVFQVESSGMMDALRRMKPTCIEDIVALVALYRPGPMENIPTYCEVKNGLRDIEPLHPTIDHILKETQGIIVYQEQVMQIAQVMAGYSLGGADLLRRAMGKKIAEEMAKERPKFIDGAKATHDVPAKKAGEVFDLLEKFANYGFNKSHAAAYAVVSYQTAWLKANHPVEFMAAVMNCDIHLTDKLAIYKREVDVMGITTVPPCVNRSLATFTVRDGQLVYALGALKNVGVEAMKMIVAARQTDRGEKPFVTLFDFARRVDLKRLGKRPLEMLARAGAFDMLDPNRRRVFDSLDALSAWSAAIHEQAGSSQVSLFGEETSGPAVSLVATRDWTDAERLQHEKTALGFYLSGHPYAAHAAELAPLVRTALSDIQPRAERYLIAGIVTAQRVQAGRKGKVAFVTLDDGKGSAEIVVFNEVWEASRAMLREDALVVVEVKVTQRMGEDGEVTGLRILAEQVYDLAAVRKRWGRRLKVSCNGNATAERLASILAPFRADGLPVIVHYTNGAFEGDVELSDAWRVAPDEALLARLADWLAPENVTVQY